MEARVMNQSNLSVTFAENSQSLREIFLFRERIKMLAHAFDEVPYLDERVASQPEDRIVAVAVEQGGRLVGSAYVHFHIFGDVMPNLAHLHRTQSHLYKIDKDEMAIVTGVTIHPLADQDEVLDALFDKILGLVRQVGCKACYALANKATLHRQGALGFAKHVASPVRFGKTHCVPVVCSLDDDCNLGNEEYRTPADEDDDHLHLSVDLSLSCDTIEA